MKINQDEIKQLAIECGAVGDATCVFYLYELTAYTAAVEAPLQARIAQLEEALNHASRQPYPFGHLELFEKALAESPSTWLVEHDKEVAAKERGRCAARCVDVRNHYISTNTHSTPEEVMLCAAASDCESAITELA